MIFSKQEVNVRGAVKNLKGLEADKITGINNLNSLKHFNPYSLIGQTFHDVLRIN